METEIIKECPFCGGSAKLYKASDDHEEYGYYVECTKCLASTSVVEIEKDSGADIIAIEKWNKRNE